MYGSHVAQASGMKRFWDARAREDPYFFVDDRLDYRRPDLERFWTEGVLALDGVLDALGVVVMPTDTIVDLGCGVGRVTRPLAARAREVLAVDVSSEMLARARELNPNLTNVRWLHGDGKSLNGIGDGEADACFSWVVFQHIPDPQVTLGYIREFGRVLSPGGWAAFQVSTDPSVHRSPPLRKRLGIRMRALTGRGPRGRDNPAWLGAAVPLEDVRRLAKEGGMDVERVAHRATQFTMVLTRKRA